MRLSHRLARISLAALLPAAGLLIGLESSAASASTHHAAPSATQRAEAIVRQLIQRHELGRYGFMHRVTDRALPLTRAAASQNWAGYADTGSGFTKVIGSWTEPSAKCSSQLSADAFWVGIDGFSDHTVEQDGTFIICQGGRATSYTWWEMVPQNSVQFVSSAVRPGDKITASVVRSGTKYALKVTDATHTAASFSRTESCTNCSNSSAEWIAEAPTNNGAIVPLPNFGKWAEHSASVSKGSTTGTISSFAHQEITMVNNSGQVKAQPGALSNGGRNFTVIWKRSS